VNQTDSKPASTSRHPNREANAKHGKKGSVSVSVGVRRLWKYSRDGQEDRQTSRRTPRPLPAEVWGPEPASGSACRTFSGRVGGSTWPPPGNITDQPWGSWPAEEFRGHRAPGRAPKVLTEWTVSSRKARQVATTGHCQEGPLLPCSASPWCPCLGNTSY
jgi:hypothetical protein